MQKRNTEETGSGCRGEKGTEQYPVVQLVRATASTCPLSTSPQSSVKYFLKSDF